MLRVRLRPPCNADTLVPFAPGTSVIATVTFRPNSLGGRPRVTFKGQRREPWNAESSSPRSRPARALGPPVRARGLGGAARSGEAKRQPRCFASERASVSLSQPDKGGCSPRCLLPAGCWVHGCWPTVSRYHQEPCVGIREQTEPPPWQAARERGSFYSVRRAGGDSLLVPPFAKITAHCEVISKAVKQLGKRHPEWRGR